MLRNLKEFFLNRMFTNFLIRWLASLLQLFLFVQETNLSTKNSKLIFRTFLSRSLRKFQKTKEMFFRLLSNISTIKRVGPNSNKIKVATKEN